MPQLQRHLQLVLVAPRAVHGGAGTALEHRQYAKTMVFDPEDGGGRCLCATRDWMLPEWDASIDYFPVAAPARPPETHRVQFCAGVSGASTRSVVYRKQPLAGAEPLPVCHGMPVQAGMILGNGSIFLATDSGDSTRPVDLLCKSACDANPDCAMAHSVCTLYFESDTAHSTHNHCHHRVRR